MVYSQIPYFLLLTVSTDKLLILQDGIVIWGNKKDNEAVSKDMF